MIKIFLKWVFQHSLEYKELKNKVITAFNNEDWKTLELLYNTAGFPKIYVDYYLYSKVKDKVPYNWKHIFLYWKKSKYDDLMFYISRAYLYFTNF